MKSCLSFGERNGLNGNWEGWRIFCPICREVRAFQLIRVGLASHVYYVSFGEGKLAGHVIRCHECGVRLKADHARYATTEKNPGHLEVLVRNTFPKLREVCAARLEMETRIRQTPFSLSADEREIFPHGAFCPAEPGGGTAVCQFHGNGQAIRFRLSGTVVVGGGLFFTSLAYHGPFQDKMLLLAAILFGIGPSIPLSNCIWVPGIFSRHRCCRRW